MRKIVILLKVVVKNVMFAWIIILRYIFQNVNTRVYVRTVLYYYNNPLSIQFFEIGWTKDRKLQNAFLHLSSYQLQDLSLNENLDWPHGTGPIAAANYCQRDEEAVPRSQVPNNGEDEEDVVDTLGESKGELFGPAGIFFAPEGRF